jgi:hypothetical protein
VDRVHGAVDRGQRRSTVDSGQRAQRRLTSARCAGTIGGARDVLTGEGGVAKRQRTGGNERWRLELLARVKDGAKELGRGGMRCGEIWRSHRPFIGAGGAPERGGRGGVTVALMALTPLKTGARLRGGLRGGGNDGGASNGLGGIQWWS